MPWNSFRSQIADWLESRGLLAPGQTWVVGVSGGPDSTLLLHTLCALSADRALGWEVHAAHLHHGLRGAEADGDEHFVAGLADQLRVPFHVKHADIPGQVAREGGSTEEVARQTRYEFLERVALTTGSELVAVAHHADDNAETVLHRICRGTGLRGLAGMADVRPIQPGSRVRLVRPFLNQRRATIERLCAAQGFETRSDSTNASPEFTRGRIRHAVLPMLREQLNPNVGEALLRLAEQARGVGTYLEDAAARLFDSLLVHDEPGHIVLSVPALLGKQRIIQAEVVRRAITLVLGGEQDLGFVHVEAVLRLADDPGSGKELHLPGPVLVRKQYDRLEFRPLEPAEPPPALAPVFVACPGRTALPMLGWELAIEECPVDAARLAALRAKDNPLEEWLDAACVRPPLLVRGRRDGDRFHPLGAPGAKTLSEFLSSEKVDPDLRGRTGILCDQDGPLWVMPLRIDERAKLRTESTRALRLVLTPAGGRAP